MTRFSIFLLAATVLCVLHVAPAVAAPQTSCIGCHARENVMPAISEEYLASRHYAEGVSCLDCHGAKEGDPDGFEHSGRLISLIVTPADCGECHEQAAAEFARSSHARSRDLVTTGIGAYFLNHLEGSQLLPDSGKYAAGANACYRCHGSAIEIGDNGRPTPATWPSAGIGRLNPDGSVGNCAACHERHDFSLAQARQPEACATCHNAAGGDPQIEAYQMSRHVTAYRAKRDRMNLHSPSWIVGQDYVAAPTCSTCHMSAAPDLPITHDINERLDWTPFLQGMNTLSSAERCGLPAEVQPIAYRQPPADTEHRDSMKTVCRSCHSGSLVDNFLAQYEGELRLTEERWLRPGRDLYQLATNVLQAAEGQDYEFLTHPIDFVWFGMCTDDANAAHTGAAMVAGGSVEQGNGGFASAWYGSFIPAIEGIIDEYKNSQGAVKEAVDELIEYYEALQNDPEYDGP